MFKMLAKIHLYHFLPKMMKVTKKEDIAPFISISFAFYLISFIFFSGITLSFTVMEAQGRLDRENPLVVECWNRALLQPVRWLGENCERQVEELHCGH